MTQKGWRVVKLQHNQSFRWRCYNKMLKVVGNFLFSMWSLYGDFVVNWKFRLDTRRQQEEGMCKSWINNCLFVWNKVSSLPLFGLLQQTTNWWQFFLFFPENRSWHFMLTGDNWHEIPKKKKRKLFQYVACWLFFFYPACLVLIPPAMPVEIRYEEIEADGSIFI